MSSEIVIAPSLFGMVAFVVWTLANAWHRNQHLKVMAEFNERLIQRLGSVKDVGEFLETRSGAGLLDHLAIERASTSVYDRVLRASGVGVVAMALGIGFLLIGGSRFMFDDHEAFMVVGVIALSLGIGCLASAFVTYLLAKALGVAGDGRR